MPRDEGVDAPRISRQHGVVRRREHFGLGLGDMTQTEAARLQIAFDGGPPRYLRHLPGGLAASHVHLPQPVLSHSVALQIDGVLDGAGANVGHAQLVSGDLSRRTDAQLQRARSLR